MQASLHPENNSSLSLVLRVEGRRALGSKALRDLGRSKSKGLDRPNDLIINPKPYTLNPKPYTLNPRHQISPRLDNAAALPHRPDEPRFC